MPHPPPVPSGYFFAPVPPDLIRIKAGVGSAPSVPSMTKLDLLRDHGLFQAQVPRYTSYPTAPHFSDRVGAAARRQWIGALKPREAISVYVHIPFCRRLCWFCACRTQGTVSAKPVRTYLDAVLVELAQVAALLPDGVRIGQIHWGGGTPTLLSPTMMTQLAQAMRDVAPLTENGGFSIEVDPNEIDAPRMDALAAAGLSRASVGVQDFDPLIQNAIGRKQGFDVTDAAIKGLRERGIDSLNIDLLYGLPYQTPDRLIASLKQVLALSPDRLALYGYAHVPWMSKRQVLIPAEALPGPEARLVLFETARAMLVKAGYVPIGIDHFARPDDSLTTAAQTGRLRRNFQGYTDDECPTLLGIGASSISRFAQGYVQNQPETAAYLAEIRANRLPGRRGHAFDSDDLMRARVIEALMCDFTADLAEVAGDGAGTLARVRKLAEQVAAEFPAVVSVKGNRISIAPEGRALTRIIVSRFDAYAIEEGRHSVAT